MLHYEKIEDVNKRLKDKQQNLEDWSRRDNLRFNGVREYENELWNDRKKYLKDFLFENLDLENIKKNVHIESERKKNTSRTIVARFSSYKVKETILKNTRKLKDMGYYINEDFPKETVEIRRKMGKG